MCNKSTIKSHELVILNIFKRLNDRVVSAKFIIMICNNHLSYGFQKEIGIKLQERHTLTTNCIFITES